MTEQNVSVTRRTYHFAGLVLISEIVLVSLEYLLVLEDDNAEVQFEPPIIRWTHFR